MKSLVRDILVTVVIAIGIFILLQTTVQISVINGHSMEPNLDDGQRLLVSKANYIFDDPDTGDIIVFSPPLDPKGTPYIKRVIGLSGDTVEIKMGKVYVNGAPVDEPYISEPPNYTVKEKKVPEGDYFVLGDNRNNSNDSHNGWTVPRENIIAKAWLSIWPPQSWGLLPDYSLD